MAAESRLAGAVQEQRHATARRCVDDGGPAEHVCDLHCGTGTDSASGRGDLIRRQVQTMRHAQVLPISRPHFDFRLVHSC